MQCMAISEQHDARAPLRAVVADGHRLAVMVATAALVQDIVGVTCGAIQCRLDVGGHGTRELMHRGAANRDRRPRGGGGAHQLRTCAWCWRNDADARIITRARLSRGNVRCDADASKREHEACQHNAATAQHLAWHQTQDEALAEWLLYEAIHQRCNKHAGDDRECRVA